MARVSRIMVRLAVVGLGTGCASLFSDATTDVLVRGKEGSRVLVDGVSAGYSPITVVVGSHRDHVIVVDDESCRLTATVSPGYTDIERHLEHRGRPTRSSNKRSQTRSPHVQERARHGAALDHIPLRPTLSASRVVPVGVGG